MLKRGGPLLAAVIIEYQLGKIGSFIFIYYVL